MPSTRLGYYYGLRMQIAPLGAYDVIQYGGFLVISHFFQSNVGFSWQNQTFYSQLQFQTAEHVKYDLM